MSIDPVRRRDPETLQAPVRLSVANQERVDLPPHELNVGLMGLEHEDWPTGSLSMNRSAGLQTRPVQRTDMAGSETGAPLLGSWSQCMRESEGRLSMNRRFDLGRFGVRWQAKRSPQPNTQVLAVSSAPTGLRPKAQGWSVCGPTLGARMRRCSTPKGLRPK